METIAYLPIGTRVNGRVLKINEKKSARLQMYSTIVGFFNETDTKLGKSISNRGFFGIVLTEKNPTELLKLGDTIEVQISSYRQSDFNGQTNIAAQANFVQKVDVKADRVSAALNSTPESAVGTRQNA